MNTSSRPARHPRPAYSPICAPHSGASPRRRTAAAACLIGAALSLIGLAPNASARVADKNAACATILTLRGWHPPVTLAGDVPTSQAIGLLRREFDWQQKVILGTQLSDKVEKTKNALWNAARDFDLQKLYQTLPEKTPDWHLFTLFGELQSDSFQVNQIPPGAYRNDLSSFGQVTSQLALRPRPTPEQGPGGDYYELRARARANIGPIAWKNVRKATWMALSNLTTPGPVAPPSGGGLVGGSGSDAEILLQLQPAFTHFFKWYLDIAKIPHLLAHDNTTGAKHLQLKSVLKDEALRQRYPHVAAYIDQLKDHLSGNVIIRSKAGRWLKFDLESENKTVKLDAWVANGHIVPTRNGEPQLDAVDPGKSLDSLSYTSIANLKLSALGVTVKLKQWPISWQYRRTGDGAEYTGRLTEQPRVEISGAALGFVPTGLVDLTIPNNIEGIVHDFIHVLNHSNEGKGAKIVVDYKNGTGGNGSRIEGVADGNTLDNFFVHFAVSLMNKRILPNDEQFEGLKKFSSDAVTAIQQDLDDLVAKRRAASNTDWSSLMSQCRGR